MMCSARSRLRREGSSRAQCAGSRGWATATRRSSSRGEILPTFVLAEPRRRRWRRSGARDTLKAFQHEHGPALKRFRLELGRRWPEIRHIGVTFEDDRGRQHGGMIQALDDEHGPDHRGIPVMAQLEPAELQITDGLITAGVAASRADALRWALSRVREAGPDSGG